MLRFVIQPAFRILPRSTSLPALCAISLLMLPALVACSGSEDPGAGASASESALGDVRSSGAQDLELDFVDGGSWKGGSLLRDSLSVLFVLSPECPLCLDYAAAFRRFNEEYGARGVRFLGVFPGTFFTQQEIRRYRMRYRLDFPAVLDPDYKLLRILGADTTPEVLLLDEQGRIAYQGGIDNWAYEVSSKRLEPSEHYLRDALDAVLAGSEPPVTRTRPVGCLIE
jgi:thiol-disulfide isomerase/thioredoxin